MLKRVFEQLPLGSFTYEDAEVIVRSLNRVESIKGDCLEIGSDLGRSSTLIAEIIKENSHLFCVDIWSNETWNELASQLGEKAVTYPRRDPKAFEIFRHNIKKRGLNAVVTPIRNKSEEAIKEFKNPLKFIFIDGCHEYEYIKKDIEWVKYLVEGGEVVFHDYTDSWPDVKAAVNEFASNHSFKLVDSGGNCICFRKRIREHSVSSSSEQPLTSVYSSSSKRIKIAAVTMVYNEALLLPYFIRHYEYLDEIYVLYETDSTDDTFKILKQASNVIIKNSHIEGGLDSLDKVNLINNTLHTIKADWVYVMDCDEFIFPPQESPYDFLIRQDRENYNVVRAGMFQVYRHRTDKDLDPSLPPIPQRVHGDPDLFSTAEGPHKALNVVYVKPIVVKPSSEIRFQPGNHVVEGNIRVSPELYMGAHWQMADPWLAIDRRIKNKARMSERNKRLGMGWQHWDVTEEWIRAECDRHLDDPLIDELYLYSDKNFKNYDSLMRSKTNMKNLNPWNHLICFVTPNRITRQSAWHEHIPFAMFLVDLLRPKMIVELGTHYGDSYCAFCQGVKELHLDTACYAVDTWQGDPQSGLYGPGVLADLRAHHDPLYSSFSRLIQSTFDEALEHFADGTVDLLHIDGYHTYESVRHDFEAWLPKMSQHGVVLFHDTNVREQDFGIRKFWDEVKLKYPHFEFRHGHGLGVLAVGKVRSRELQELFKLPEEESIRIRDFFFQLGHQLTTRVRNKAMASELENQKGQLQELNADLESKGARIVNLETNLQENVSQIHSLEYQIHSMEYQIQHSVVMQLLNRYQRIVEKLLRTGTRRRYYYELGLSGIRVILNEGLKSFFRKARYRLVHRPAAVKRLRHDLPKFNASILKKEADKLVFPLPSEKPEVSIVIPACNNWRYTLNCLKSIAKNTDGDYKVFVIDDASTDATAEVLSKVKNLHLVTNKQNAGVIESCNRGAKASKGKYILFLNNDTMVAKGWLPPLLELIKREDVGAVGSKLVYPGGTLCEASSIIWRDGSALGYGRGDDSSKPEYNYIREVDYCSGASLMVKGELFEKIGGFDEKFKPSYYEDADLCFAFKNLGYKVMYQPMSVVVHFEGVTSGRDTLVGIKQYQEINRPKFVEKWSQVLQKHHYPPVAENAFLARDRVSGKRILVIDTSVPTYDKDSGSFRMFNLLKILVELGNKVTFIGGNLLRLEPYTEELQQKGIEVIYAPYFFSAEAYIERYGRFFDVVILSRAHIAMKHLARVKQDCFRAKVVYDTVDLHFLRESRQASIENNEKLLKQAEKTKATELHLAKNSDITFVVSPVEKEILLKEDPSLNVKILSNIHCVTKSQKSFSERKDLLFIGGFAHLPNVDSAIYFIKEIFPLVKRRLPDVCLYIVGSNPPKGVLSLQSDAIVVTGYIKDVAPYFDNCRVFVAPLRYGAGVKGKINQSMSYGLPVVTTPIGAEGIALVDGLNALIADEPEEFAERVATLYEDEELWNKLSQSSIKNVEQYYSYNVAKAALKEILSK